METLRQMMRTFVAGEDRSLLFVNRIEGHLLEHFQDSWIFEELTLPVASYRPGGGEGLYDERDLAREFLFVLNKLPTQ